MMEENKEPVIQDPAPAEVPVQEPATAQNGSGKKTLAMFAAVLIFALVLLSAAGFVYLHGKSKLAYTSQPVPTNTPTEAVVASPTPVNSINSTQDLDTVLNELNTTSDSGLQNDLNQANSEGNSL